MISNDVTAIYVRVSTMKESQKDSPEHQKGLCEEKARMLELAADHPFIYEDRDSGTSIVGRPDVQRLIKDAKAGRFKNIIFASLSRFSRDTLDSLNLKRILVDALGIRLISIEEGYDSAKDNDELKFQIISAVNQKLSEQISLSSKRGIRQSARKGNFTGSITPYGYKKVVIDDRKTLVPDQATKDTVKLIYDLYTVHKMGEKAIVNYLNREKKIPSYKGGSWGLTSVQRILTNEVYTGENVFCKYEVKKVYNDINNMTDRTKKQTQRDKSKWERSNFKTHEPIIDDETFELARQIRLERGNGKRGGVRNRVNVFAGRIFCKHCGGAMVSMKGGKSKSEGVEYRYLICSARRRQGEAGCENHLWIPYYDFMDTVIREVSGKLRHMIHVDATVEAFRNKIVKAKSREKMIGKEIQKIEKSIEASRKLLFELRKQKMLGEMDDEQYQFEKEWYEKDIATAQAQLPRLKNQMEEPINLDQVYGEIAASLEDLIKLNFEQIDELRMVLFKFIEKLVISKNGEVEIFTPLGEF